jgi:hypothetical protein
LKTSLRILLGAGLALGAAAGAPAWVSIGESESTAYYLDPDTVRADGTHRRVWRLFEYKAQQREGVKSGKALIDIDCQAGTYRYLKTMYYSEPLGKGKYLGGRGEHRKEYIGPGTMIGQLANLVCQPAGENAAAAKPASAASPK